MTVSTASLICEGCGETLLSTDGLRLLAGSVYFVRCVTMVCLHCHKERTWRPAKSYQKSTVDNDSGTRYNSWQEHGMP